MSKPFEQLYTISDLHVDYPANLNWLKSLDPKVYGTSCLIVSGDLTDSYSLLRETLARLRATFGMVLFVPGNHELWVRKQLHSSIEKFNKILELCSELDIKTGPTRVNDVHIVPLFSWYDDSLAEKGCDLSKPVEGWSDDFFCRWDDLQDVSGYFMKLNESRIRSYGTPVISFSHFAPRTELIPPSKQLFFKDLHRVLGSNRIESQIRALGSQLHIFGHTHIPFSRTIDGCHYLHQPLGYPDELARPYLGPLSIGGSTKNLPLDVPPDSPLF